MSWIQRHWEPAYIVDAETKIQQMVTLCSIMIEVSHDDANDCYKMLEYREDTATEEVAPSTSKESSEIPRYMSLAAKYGIRDEMDIGSSSSTSDQTIEQEYQSYITAALSPKTIDIIKFWEVSHIITIYIDAAGCGMSHRTFPSSRVTRY